MKMSPHRARRSLHDCLTERKSRKRTNSLLRDDGKKRAEFTLCFSAPSGCLLSLMNVASIQDDGANVIASIFIIFYIKFKHKIFYYDSEISVLMTRKS